MLKMTSTEDVTGSSPESKMAVNGPVFFLIREQAKSVVAIKELQARLTVLEDIQERLMQAIQNVQQHLVCNKTGQHAHPNPSVSASSRLANTKHLKETNARDQTTNNLTNIHTTNDTSSSIVKQDLLSSVPAAKGDSKVDSINKDSGVVSDYREPNNDGNYVPYNVSTRFDGDAADDELLQLLEIIDRKSLILLQQVEDIGNMNSVVQETAEVSRQETSDSSDHMMVENVVTQRQLCEMKADRDDLRQRLAKLELATDTVVQEKKKLQKKLDSVVVENQQLQAKIQNARGMADLKNSHADNKASKSSIVDMERADMKRKYLQYSEKSRKKVSLVLKESNVIELQRQLLTYIMENDVLQAKLEQNRPESLSNWLKIEAHLKIELKKVTDDKEKLDKALKEKNAEITSLRDRVKVLEEAWDEESQVKNFGMGSTADWREPSNQNQRGNLNVLSPLGFGDFSKTQSLPAMIHLDDKAKLHRDKTKVNYGHGFDSDNFTEIPLDHSSCADHRLSNSCNESNLINTKDRDLVDLTDPNDSELSNTSTLLQSGYWNQPAISADWSNQVSLSCCHLHTDRQLNQSTRWQNPSLAKTDSSVKLINGHLCWKGSRQVSTSDLDSIRTEFDPLSGTASCENFVDSLNLSIPLKPTQMVSQLSSIGDSLHSASLDLGCASSAVWHHDTTKLSTAWSVDGIRQLLIEPGLSHHYKGRTVPRCAQNASITSVISGKAGRPLPMNILNCMHSSPDYKLL